MTAPIVKTPGRSPQPPPVPERMDIETEWPAKLPDGQQVMVELWADRGRRDAEVRVLRGPVIGTLTAATSADKKLIPDPHAVEQYGPEWVESQLRSASQSLAIRWCTSAWRRQ